MTLKLMVGRHEDVEQAIILAIGKFNEETDEVRVFRQAQVIPERGECLIWYTTSKKEEPSKKFEYIGSVEIDPTDPDWRTKWQSQTGDTIKLPTIE